MKKTSIVALTVTSIGLCAGARAQEPQEVCKAEQTSLRAFVDSTKADFQKEVDATRDRIQKKADNIKRDAPTPGTVDGAVGLDFDVKWTDQKISLDLPEVTLKQQKWVYDIPQVTMKLQEIIFDTPSVRMVPQKVGQYPEFHGFTVKWRDIIAHVPQTFMERQTIKMHIPEFRTDRTETILGVPEFVMKRQEMVLRLPEFTLKNVKVEASRAKARGEALSADSKTEIESEVKSMKLTLQQGISSNVSALFGCMRTDMRVKRASVEQAFSLPIQQLSIAITQLQAAKATDKAGETQAQLIELVKKKDDTLQQIDVQLGNLDAQEQAAIKQTSDNLAKT